MSALIDAAMTFAIVLGALILLMLAAYRGYSVILFAPVAALLAVLLPDPGAAPSVFTGLFMERMVGFLKLYFPLFLLGAVFGKVIELSGFSQAIAAVVIRLVGQQRAMLSIAASATTYRYFQGQSCRSPINRAPCSSTGCRPM